MTSQEHRIEQTKITTYPTRYSYTNCV